jgi:ATP-dependent Clp protease ATP-binding subunit ClpC
MINGERYAKDGWDLVLTAKAISLAAGADAITRQHLFQAVALRSAALIQDALRALPLPADRVAAHLHGIAFAAPLPEPGPSERKPLSEGAESVLHAAEGLASEHALDAKGLVGAVHVWVGLATDGAGELGGWLRDCGWMDEAIGGLSRVAPKQLPPRQPAVAIPLKDSARAVLERFCHRDLTRLAREGRLAPAFGMESARGQIVRSLLRRDRRSLVLTGPAGVGKTKLVEDLACRIARGELAELAACHVFELDLAAFTRGTHLAGSRAERWSQIIEVLRAHSETIILFIDELHTVVGLPLEGQAMDLANMLKPLLVDHNVRIVGATTSEEYRRHIEADPALARRFTEVRVPEPDKATMLRLLRSIVPDYENYHGVEFSPPALEAIYDLAELYVPNQAFPAKGVDLLDEVAVNLRLRSGAPGTGAQPGSVPRVSPEDVADCLKRVRGIEPAAPAADIAGLLKTKVIGQDEAADRLADVVMASALGYGRQTREGPKATILFLGPPGVGKSFMARVLAETLFPGRRNLLTLDMTEFGGDRSGEHARFRLLGPPAPYVGWENGGLLASYVLQHPAAVVLIDELDKAGPEARNILLRVFNDGWVQDGRGRVVSFREVYFILTANAARGLWEKVKPAIGFGPVQRPPDRPVPPTDLDVREALAREGFAAELLSRISHIVLFNELTDADLERVAGLKLAGLGDQALVEDSLLLEYDLPAMTAWLLERSAACRDVRGITAALERFVEFPLARWRWQHASRSQWSVLRLDPGPEGLRLAVPEPPPEGAEIERLLFERVAVVFAQRDEHARQVRTVGARLGSRHPGE